MKKYLLLIMIYIPVFSQSGKEHIIYASTSKNVNIFFRSAISTAIVGSDTYSFGFDREEKSTYGILKAIPGIESNLLITTENGNIFSFIIRYKKEISELNYFINDSLAIGNIKGHIFKPETESLRKISDDFIKEIPATIKDKTSKTLTVNDYETTEKLEIIENNNRNYDNYNSDRNSYYENYCSNEIKKNRFYTRFYGQSNNVFLRLKNISYDKDELYFTLIIDNNSNLDYDVEDLTFFITAKNKSKKTSTQQIKYEPVFVHEVPKRFDAHTSKEVVYVFKKFSINNQKILLVSLSEFKGERNINLEIPNIFINNPN